MATTNLSKTTINLSKILKGGKKEIPYSEKLKDPRWQKKRLEILSRDNFTCQHCGSTDKTLHVHHIQYPTKNPWDAGGRLLITLCDDCHSHEHSFKKENYCNGLQICEITKSALVWEFIKTIDSGCTTKDLMSDIIEFMKTKRKANGWDDE